MIRIRGRRWAACAEAEIVDPQPDGDPYNGRTWQGRHAVKILIALVIAAGIGVGGWFSWQKWREPVPVSYRTAEVSRGNLVATVSATGNLEPLVTVLVGSQVSGTVTRWYADFNQEVTKGFLLAELDQDRFKATVSQRTAALGVARARADQAAAQRDKAKVDYDLLKSAYEHEGVSEVEMREADTTLRAAEAELRAQQAQVESAQADLQLAEVDLSKTLIYSPIDGVVIERNVDAGQTVAASLQAPTLFTIANDLTRMRVSAAVSETDIGKIHEGLECSFRVDAYTGRKFRGKVSQVRYAQTVVDNVVTYTTLIEVDNPDLSLRPGMTATILFEVAKAEDVLLVPNAALRFEPGAPEAPATGASPWMARPAKGRPPQPRVFTLQDGQLVEIAVKPGLTDGANTQVTSDQLSAGDRVVTDQIVGAAGRRPGGGGPRMPRGM